MKKKSLIDGITQVPAKSNYFTKKYENYNIQIPHKVESNVLYVEDYYLYGQKRIKYNKDSRKAFVFYPNGNVNYFILNKVENLSSIILNPEISGYRGVSYKKEIWHIDIFSMKYDGGIFGINRYFIEKIENQKIFLSDFTGETIYILSKQEIPGFIHYYETNW